MRVAIWYILIIMKNISELDGLSRSKRLERAVSPVTLPVLEERFPILLARALSQSDFTSLYKFQPLVILLEIELFDVDAAEKAFMQFSATDEFVPAVYALTLQMDDWCRRLEYACLSGKPLALLRDLSGQISANISPMFTSFYKQYGNYPLQTSPRPIWLAAKKKSKDESLNDDFPRRFYLLLLASIRLMQSKCELYREEIYASGKMDPSLAIMVAFLHNYKDLAVAYNNRWREIPLLYLNEILKVSRRKQNAGTTWLAFESSPVGVGAVIPQGSYWKTEQDDRTSGYQLLSDVRLTQMALAGTKMVVMEKNKERYPEAALNYVTALKQKETLKASFSPAQIGLCLRSPMLLLGEGKRKVQVLFGLTAESLSLMDSTIAQIAQVQDISWDEAQFKVLHDSIHVYRDARRLINKDLGFFFTFSKKAAAEHSGFISGLQCFVDSVYFADFDSLGISSRILYNDGSIDTSSVYTRVVNPFYLFRIPYKTIDPGNNNGDIWRLMVCDYASGQWGLFLCIDLCILFMLLALLIMRYISVPFNVYIEKYYTFVVLLMITLVMEFGVFFFFMIEALSPQVIYFDLETGSMTYLTLIALPIVPILLYFLILKLNKREPVP